MTKRLIEEIKLAGGELGSNAAATRALDAVIDAIKNVTGQGERVVIRGFGVFQEKTRNERQGRNPKTGEPIKIAAQTKLMFRSTAKD